MNKFFTKLLSIALFFFSWAAAQGQVYVLNENFNGTTGNTPPTGWSNNTLSGGGADTWRFNNPGGRALNNPISSPAAIFDSDDYSAGGGAEDVTLESPSINTIGKPAITLRFDHQFQGGFGGRATVEVWDGSSWNQVYNTTATVTTKTESINITSLAANKSDVKVRFRWRGNFSWWWLVDNVQMFYIVDVQTVSVDAPRSPCGNANDSIRVTVKNNSAFTVKNVPVKVDLSGGLLSGTQSLTIDSIEASSSRQVAFAGGNTTSGGTLNVTAYTELTGDNTKTNDTTTFTLNVVGTPADPTVTPGDNCGAGSVMLGGSTGLTTDSVVWYANNPATSAPLAFGPNFTTPFISSTTNFYVASGRGDYRPKTFTTVTNGTNGQRGAMFNITPQKDIVIDSLAFVEFTSLTGTYQIRVYYKKGTYVGNNTNAGAWTDHGTFPVTSAGADVPLTFNIDDLELSSGELYGFYITVISGPQLNLHYSTLGSNTTYSNADIRIDAGIGVQNLFGGSFSPRGWNGRIHYRLKPCESNLVPVTATIKPVAAGTTISGQTGSKGTFNGGTLTSPDVNASPDSIMYDLVTPTGFNDADYGSAGTWEVSSITATATGGTVVPATMYSLVNPTSLSGGVFRMHTDTTFTDSVLKVDVNVRRLDNGCDTTITKYIYIASRPKARFNAPEVCDGDITLFDNSSYLQVGTLSYKWKFGQANAESDLANPFYKYSGAGTYNVTLIVESNYGYKDSVTQTITIRENPKANFEITNACEGTAVGFRDASILPSGTPTYSWDFGDGNTGNTDNETNLYNLPGIYPVRMIVEVGGCSDEITKYATQAPRSKPDFGFTALQCDNADVTFTNNTTNPSFGTVAYTWKLGDGTEENRIDLSYTYNAFKTYDVVLIGRTDLGCIDSVSKSITLKESPVADFNIVGSTCSNRTLTFNNTTTQPAGGTPNSYEWAFGDANTSTDDSPSHQYVGPGVKTITLIARNTNGCEGTINKDITINLKPNADFVAKDVCLGTETVFSNNSSIGDASALTYEWLIDGDTTTNTNESKTFTTDGVKNVRLVSTSKDNCTDTANRTVEVFPQPVPVISIASQLSFDGAFNFATNTQGASYRWLFGDGSTATTQNTTYKYPIDGTYVVRLVITSDKGCIGIDQDTIIVNRLSVDDFLIGSVKLYPNPGNGAFDIEFTDMNTNDIKSVVVLNNLGQKVAVLDTKEIANNTLAINIANEAAGIYFIQVETTSGKASFKYNLVK